MSKDLSRQKSLKPQDPKLKILLEKEDYFKGEIMVGKLRIKLERDMPVFVAKIGLVKEENFVLFNSAGNQALRTGETVSRIHEMQVRTTEKYEAGTHFLSFGIRIPENVKGATFYHQSQTAVARIVFYLKAKIFEEASGEGIVKYAKVKNFRLLELVSQYKTNKSFLDETNPRRLLCFGGGRCLLKVDLKRDAFHISSSFLTQQREEGSIDQNQSAISVLSQFANLKGKSDPERVIELQISVSNKQNRLPVSRVLVQLLQVVALKEPAKRGYQLLKHVKEVLYLADQEGVYERDETDQPRSVRVSLKHLLKNVLKQQAVQGKFGVNDEVGDYGHAKGIQQTCAGELIENFYVLRVKAEVQGNEEQSPLIDTQITFAMHDLN